MPLVSEYYWYCSWCGYGPHLRTLHIACIECGRRLGWDEEVSTYSLSRIESSQPLARATYSAPRTTPPQTLAQSESKSDLTFQNPPNPHSSEQSTTIGQGLVNPKEIFPTSRTDPKEDYLSSLSPDESNNDNSLFHNSPKADSTQGIADSLAQEMASQRAEYLSNRILGGIQFDINFQASVITCTGKGSQTPSRPSQNNGAGQGYSSSSGDTGSGSGSARRHGKRERSDNSQEARDRDKKRCDIKKSKLKESTSEPLACPFYKRNRRECTRYRACAGPGWMLIYRLREHLFRDHIIFQCGRCWETFPTATDLDDHLQKLTPCPVRQKWHVFAINQQTREKLQIRKKFDTREENWKWIFSVIFPYIPNDQIPSPYYEPEDEENDDDNNRMFSFFRSELPSRTGDNIKRRLEESLANGGDGNARYLEYKGLIDRKEFSDLLRDSILEAVNELQNGPTRDALQLRRRSENGKNQVGEPHTAFDYSETTCDPDSSLWTHWEANVDLSNYNANIALRDVDALENLDMNEFNDNAITTSQDLNLWDHLDMNPPVVEQPLLEGFSRDDVFAHSDPLQDTLAAPATSLSSPPPPLQSTALNGYPPAQPLGNSRMTLFYPPRNYAVHSQPRTMVDEPNWEFEHSDSVLFPQSFNNNLLG